MTRVRWIALIAGGLLIGAAFAGAAVFAPDDRDATSTVVRPKPKPKPKPKLEQVRGLAARIAPGDRVVLRKRPGGGRVLARVGSRTEFGSPQTLAIAQRKGDWLAVRSPALDNDQLGWVDTRTADLRLVQRDVSLEVDLSDRTLTLIKRGVIYRRDAAGIGARETSTPTGSFYVTDKLAGPDFGSYYGCCILALSGRQPNLPQGWSGGDRLAIHGTPTPDFGEAVTNGCLHLPDEVLRLLMKDIPLGTPVEIRA